MALRPSLADDDDCDASNSSSSSSGDFASSSLDDALSFMGGFDLRFDSASAVAQPQPQLSSRQQPPAAAAAARHPKPTKRAASHGVKPSTAARSQQQVRRRSEIVKLRDQVRELQDRRAELQSAPVPPSSYCDGAAAAAHVGMPVAAAAAPTAAPACSSVHASAAMWLNQAVHQYEQLQQSEAMNDNLRETLVKQIELRQLLDAQVQEHAAVLPLCAMQVERGSPLCSTAVSSVPRVTQGCPFIRIEQLHKSVAAVRRGIDAILQQFGPLSDLATSIFSSSQTKTDPVRGPVFELKSSAPVPSSVCDLARLLWKILGVSERQSEDIEMVDGDDASAVCPDVSAADSDANAPVKAEDSHEKWYNMKLQTQFGEVDVEGASVLCKYVEARRVAFAFASSIAVADSDMVFRESGWFVLAEAEPPSSLFQTFYQLQPQHPPSAPAAPVSSSGSASSADCAYLQDLVMNALGNRMRLHHQQLQSLLLKGATSASASSAARSSLSSTKSRTTTSSYY